MLVLGGILFLSLDKDKQDISMKVCKDLPSPIIDTDKPLSESMKDFEEHSLFKGYKLNDYKDCN
jgi:hypothetical protein